MDKITKFLLNWKICLPIFIVLAVFLYLAPAAFRKVGVYHPPNPSLLSGWGTMPEETAARLQSVLDGEVNRLSLPGLQAAIQNDAGETWYGVSGTVDPGRHIPLQQDHILRIGSVTKTFTAVVILQLAEEGCLSLDDPLALWFPEFPNADEITIRDLLSQRSGIYNYLENPQVLASLLSPRYVWQTQALIDIASQAQPHEMGEYYYSNTNYVLLGLIAEQVTGQDAAILYRQRIIEPLGLQSTWFVPYETTPANLISGYDRDMTPLPGLYEFKPSSFSAATAAFTSGAIASTAEDLLKFYMGLFSGKLLSPILLEKMTTFHDASDPGTPQLTGYGLGLFRLEIHGEVVWASLGEFIGFMTMVAYSPSEHDTVAMIGNLSLFDYVSVWTDLIDVSRK